MCEDDTVHCKNPETRQITFNEFTVIDIRKNVCSSLMTMQTITLYFGQGNFSLKAVNVSLRL